MFKKRIKKWQLLRFYIKTLKKHSQDIRNHFILNTNNFTYKIIDMNYDRVYRFYTVINMPTNTTENIQKYGYRYLDNETKKFIAELNKQFQKYGLLELVGLSKADQINESSVLVVVEYKLLKTSKIAKNIIWLIILLLVGALSLLLFL
jgi:hypothetical protein